MRVVIYVFSFKLIKLMKKSSKHLKEQFKPLPVDPPKKLQGIKHPFTQEVFTLYLTFLSSN